MRIGNPSYKMLKERLIEKLKEINEKRIKTAQDAIENARKSANEESKSSVGDKYETARAMGQLDQEMQSRQLEQFLQEKAIIEKIDAKDNFSKVGQGALVETTMGTFFVAVGVGMIEMENQKIMLISPQSPIGQILKGKSVGESFVFREKSHQILSIL